MNDHGNPLPSAIDLAGMLQSATLAEVAATIGTSRKAITTKLRRHGMALGSPQKNYVCKNRLSVIAAPLKKERALHPDRVYRTTLSGAVVTLSRIPTIDGHANG